MQYFSTHYLLGWPAIWGLGLRYVPMRPYRAFIPQGISTSMWLVLPICLALPTMFDITHSSSARALWVHPGYVRHSGKNLSHTCLVRPKVVFALLLQGPRACTCRPSMAQVRTHACEPGQHNLQPFARYRNRSAKIKGIPERNFLNGLPIFCQVGKAQGQNSKCFCKQFPATVPRSV